jgi:DNA transformation protein
MARNSAFLAQVVELLGAWGRVTTRPMFSGWALYRDGVVFALVLGDALYFKVDAANRAAFESAGSAPFRYQRADRAAVVTSYWEAPADVFDDSGLLMRFADGALAASRRSARKRSAKTRSAKKVKKHQKKT